jgi:hypothetical protein
VNPTRFFASRDLKSTHKNPLNTKFFLNFYCLIQICKLCFAIATMKINQIDEIVHPMLIYINKQNIWRLSCNHMIYIVSILPIKRKEDPLDGMKSYLSASWILFSILYLFENWGKIFLKYNFRGQLKFCFKNWNSFITNPVLG